jgi:hypothetical protein
MCSEERSPSPFGEANHAGPRDEPRVPVCGGEALEAITSKQLILTSQRCDDR